jgi:hypothetical protein
MRGKWLQETKQPCFADPGCTFAELGISFVKSAN